MFHRSSTTTFVSQRLARLVVAVLLVACTATSVGAQPAADATLAPPQQAQLTVAAAPTATGFAEPLSPPAGNLDTTFDGDGKVTTAILSSNDGAGAVAIQSDGKIVAAGYALNGSDKDFALARYNNDGSLDTSFDGDGKVTTAILGSIDHAYAVAIQGDGKIVAAGSAYNGRDYDFALARYWGLLSPPKIYLPLLLRQ